MKTIHFFLDFDGTIAASDVVDLVLEKYADKKWKEIEKEWSAGKIGSRECLSRQISLIKANPDDLKNIAYGVSLDPYFLYFLKKAEELGVLVTIVSDGFDILIEQVLKKNFEKHSTLLKALPIFSNKLVRDGEGFKAVFATEPVCEHGCANCKAKVIKKSTSFDDHVFFVGDGLSDRYAAETVHLTFAKGKLLDYCKSKNLDAIAYQDFKKITEWLSDNYPLLRKTNITRTPESKN